VKYRFRRRILYTLLLVVDRLFFIIPYKIGIKAGGACGRIIYRFLPRYSKLVKEHLRMAFGSYMPDMQIKAVAESVFANMGMGLVEIFNLPKIQKDFDSIISVEGIDRIDNALAKGKGAIALSAHLGAWELIAMYFAYKGYSSNIVARPIYYEKFNEWLAGIRRGMGVNVVYRTDSPLKLLRILKKGQLLGIVADQDIDSIEGVFVDFFGKKAYTPTAPVKLSHISGAPIIPIFIVREGKRHKIFVDKPIYIDDSSRPDWVVFYTQKWSDIVESYIRRYPQQWVWMHRRWKTVPKKQAAADEYN